MKTPTPLSIFRLLPRHPLLVGTFLPLCSRRYCTSDAVVLNRWSRRSIFPSLIRVFFFSGAAGVVSSLSPLSCCCYAVVFVVCPTLMPVPSLFSFVAEPFVFSCVGVVCRTLALLLCLVMPPPSPSNSRC